LALSGFFNFDEIREHIYPSAGSTHCCCMLAQLSIEQGIALREAIHGEP